MFAAKRSRTEATSRTTDLLREDSCVFSELVSHAGASLHADGTPVQLCKLLCHRLVAGNSILTRFSSVCFMLSADLLTAVYIVVHIKF